MQFNSTGFSLFGLTIRYYGLLIAMGFALGIALAIVAGSGATACRRTR